MHDIAPAKVNLTLRVLGRRADGYHALESLVTFAGVGDRVDLSPGSEPAVSTSGPFAGGIDGENLLSRVMAEIAAEAPELRCGAVHLQKNLPVAAGLGGGSSDAATLIRLLQHANAGHPDLARIDWQALATRLGADVPVCVARRPTLMWGIGEKLSPLPGVAGSPDVIPAVLVNPGVPLATRDVFRALAAAPLSGEVASPVLPRLRSVDEVAAYMRAVGNDLERPAQALLPVIRDVKAALAAQEGCLHTALSGSGPTCIALYASNDAAATAAATLTRVHPRWWAVATTLDFPG